MPATPSTPDALLPEFDQEMATTRRGLERVPSDQGKWTSLDLAGAAGYGVFVYLRLLDVPVPSIYGPTADEKAF